MTPQEAARRLGVLAKEVDRATVNAIRRGQNHWRTLTIRGIVSKGVGAAIWGARSRTKKAKRLTSLRPIIKRERVKKVGESTYIAGLQMTGLAALQETGGQTKAHEIKATGRGRVPRLIFEGASGWVNKIKVSHPGSKIPARPSAAPAVPEVSAYTQEQINTGLVQAIDRAGLGGG